MARRRVLPAPDPLDVARPVADRGDAPRHAGRRAGDDRGARGRAAGGGRRSRPASTCWPTARARLRRGPGRGRASAARRRAPHALERYGLERFLADWDDLLGGGDRRCAIALVSEHASPLAVLGGVDAGGQNVHVAALARCAGPAGRTRSSSTRAATTPTLPRRVALAPGRRRSTTSTPARRADRPRTSCSPHMDAFAARARAQLARRAGPTSSTAHFWMSGLAALRGRARARHPGRAHLPRARRRQAPLPGRRATRARRSAIDARARASSPRRRPHRRHLHRRGRSS